MNIEIAEKQKSHILSIAFTASVTGVLTSLIIAMYKLCAGYVISFSGACYAFLNKHLLFTPLVIVALFGIACLLEYIYKLLPQLKGGGIPVSIFAIQGKAPFKWLYNLVGTFVLSLTSFFIGVPLGNEGPSVQMGTAVGGACALPFAKKNKSLEKYSMTGGACAGFGVATGSPVSGIIFAFEEAGLSLKPFVLVAASFAVLLAHITTKIIELIFKVDLSLFGNASMCAMPIKYIWISALCGIIIGLFSVLFLRYYNVVNTFFNSKLKISHKYKIFIVLLLTFILGLISLSFVSTGHSLMLSLFDGKSAILLLIIILLVRTTLTLSANVNGITGGMFVPLLVLGALLGAVIGNIAVELLCVEQQYYAVILALGITACVAGMMKMPLTAIAFSLEAIMGYKNTLHILIVVAFVCVITKLFKTKSINDVVLEKMEIDNKSCL